MLVLRGTQPGMKFTLFVMVSNYELDKVEQANVKCELSCKEASSFCGLRDRLYPDKRNTGFPFDRPSRTASNIQEFLTPNMAVADVTIRLADVTIQSPRNAQN
ncbi:hypothetical protein evm_005076 [Chilo suppressalis]|nr:hypothetical protein evm_005076 [Chilo suppressalis]